MSGCSTDSIPRPGPVEGDEDDVLPVELVRYYRSSKLHGCNIFAWEFQDVGKETSHWHLKVVPTDWPELDPGFAGP